MIGLTLEELARCIPPAGMGNRAVLADKLEFALFCGLPLCVAVAHPP